MSVKGESLDVHRQGEPASPEVESAAGRASDAGRVDGGRMAETDTGRNAARAAYNEAIFNDMLNMSAPQERYAGMVKEGVVMPVPGMAIPASRHAVDTVLRHHDIFTSEFGLDLDRKSVV